MSADYAPVVLSYAFWCLKMGCFCDVLLVFVGMGCLIIATGVPVYLICVKWKNKPKSFNRFIGKWKNKPKSFNRFIGKWNNQNPVGASLIHTRMYSHIVVNKPERYLTSISNIWICCQSIDFFLVLEICVEWLQLFLEFLKNSQNFVADAMNLTIQKTLLVVPEERSDI